MNAITKDAMQTIAAITTFKYSNAHHEIKKAPTTASDVTMSAKYLLPTSFSGSPPDGNPNKSTQNIADPLLTNSVSQASALHAPVAVGFSLLLTSIPNSSSCSVPTSLGDSAIKSCAAVVFGNAMTSRMDF